MTRLVVRGAAVTMMVIAAARAAASLDPQNAPPTAESQLIDQIVAARTDEARAEVFAAHAPALTTDFVRALTARGLELRRTSRLDEAGRAFIAAKQIAERLGDQLRVANSLINYAAVPGQQGDYPAALAAAKEAQAIAERLKDDDLLSAALATVGIVKKLVGDLDGAMDTYRQSLALAQAGGRRETEARVLNNMALASSLQGHYREALDRYQQSLAIFEALSFTDDIGLALNNIGVIYETQGNDTLALTYYRRALDLRKSTGTEIATELSNIAHVNLSAGRNAEALADFQQVLKMQEASGLRPGIATALFNIASVHREDGHFEEALEGYRRSIEIREAINDPAGLTESYVDTAITYASLRRYEEGIAAAERARKVAVAMNSDDRLWQPQTVLGQLHQALHHTAEAERAYRDAIDTIERLRTQLAGGADSREKFLETKLNAYRGLANILIDQRRTSEAFAVAERAHGRVLAEALEAGDVAVRPLTDAERARQRELEQDVVSRTAQLAALRRRPTADRTAVAGAAERLRQPRVAYDELRDALDARYPVRRLARGAVDADLMSALADIGGDVRVAVLEYVVGGEGLNVIVATKSADEGGAPRIQAFALPGTKAALVARVNGFRRKLAARAPDFHADARALYGTLLAPARAALAGRTRLVIVPDDVLWYVPFEALEPATDRAIVDTASVAYVPSIGVLRAMRQRRAALSSRRAAPQLLVAANPVSDLPKLPEAEQQARDLAAIYGAGQTRSYVAGAATEARVRTAATGATVIHFATHGVIDDVSPMYSFLQLSRGGRNDADNDGRLEAWEIQSLKLDALVAVLTACDTGRGRLSSGEGVIGLAWAFFAAGTPSTIVSLWELESASATTLTLALHRRLRASLMKGESAAAENLRAAALELRRDPRFRHPFYWAGLVAVGDGF